MKTVQDLRSIQSQSILRLNCQGYGQAAVLSEHGAPPLTEFKVIILNPISLAHFFSEEEEIIKQIDLSVSEGLTSFKLPNDEIINKIAPEIKIRTVELTQFLEAGGLLIYFLCRPFVLIGQSKSLDNYAWLGKLAPDQGGKSADLTSRHMSTVAHGRNIDKTEEAEKGEFSKYFEQTGLEWNTIIRSEFLTQGYQSLAFAGPKKCIAGEAKVGDKGGRVVFLPAPYSPDFDRTLIDCVYQWHTDNQEAQISSVQIDQADKKETSEEMSQTKIDLKDEVSTTQQPVIEQIPETPVIEPVKSPITKPEAISQPEQPSHLSTPKSDQPRVVESSLKKVSPRRTLSSLLPPVINEGNALSSPNVMPQPPESQPQPASAQGASNSSPSGEKFSPQNNNFQEESTPNSNSSNVNGQEKESVNLSSKPNIPSTESAIQLQGDIKNNWAANYSIKGIDALVKETEAVKDQIKQLEKQIFTTQKTLNCLETLKVPLLSGRGDIIEGCKVIFNSLGWTSAPWQNKTNELLLSENGQTMALVHISVSKEEAQRAEIAFLQESVINHWNEHTTELKGIFIVCSFADTPIEKRKKGDFSDTEIEFAKHKDICLLSTLQLLYIYRDIGLNNSDAKAVSKKLLSCGGLLSGFSQ